ncbi:MAG: putative O-glycosylation ligase, exosortase A system-associated [Aquabacterium sp.]|jgi:probable O-glycosylation ligase (exosortase A-associated)|uniref:putative O-glycosylation ligase, exosortase A system-associated n=1 Tax=Aquabacterium sp. TaxID=1872578 RepID=UPI002A36CFA0|nr:putative O-glycosylation ligase, exosortase A system-associated [Aquabacterium sp.]MDX9843851.1 putative O-glycosylation ligase, exosortase A system-associated [Aquabacterium sp.]
MFVITLGLVPMAFMDGFVAFLLWIFTTVMSPGNYLYGFMLSFRYVFVFAGIAVLLLMLGRVKDRGKFQWNASTVLLFLFVMHGMLSAAFALQPNPLLEIRVETFWKGMALALMAPFFLSSRWRIHLTLVVLALGLGLHAVVDGLKVLASGGAHNVIGVPNSSLTDNNLYALGMAMLLPLLMYLYRYSSVKYAKWAAAAGVVLTILTIIGTNSRGGFLALAVVGFWYWMISPRKLVSLLLVAALAFGAMQVAPDRWFDRIESIQTASEDDSFMNRVAAWRVSMSIANDHPVLGGGFNAVQNFWIWDEYKERPSPFTIDMSRYTPKAAHSIYFQVLGDLGYVGLSIFLALLASAFYARARVKSIVVKAGRGWWALDLSNAGCLALVAFMAAGGGVSLAYFELVYFLIVMLSVLPSVLAAESAETRSMQLERS